MNQKNGNDRVNENSNVNSESKKKQLENRLQELGSVAIAFSSGVDSTFLLKVAHDVLGDRAVAVTARASYFPGRETEETVEFCKREGIRQYFVDVTETEIPGFCENPANRCYFCKRELFQKIMRVAKEQGITYVCEGSNVDDLGDYRPGLQAIAELGVESPLRDVGLQKAEIRALSQELELPTWNKNSYACLASRFAYGERITKEKLARVEKAEQLLMDMGFDQLRVRIHGDLARIEVYPQEFDRIMEPDNRNQIVSLLKEYGFTYVTLDLQGYRMGSMNEQLL